MWGHGAHDFAKASFSGLTTCGDVQGRPFLTRFSAEFCRQYFDAKRAPALEASPCPFDMLIVESR